MSEKRGKGKRRHRASRLVPFAYAALHNTENTMIDLHCHILPGVDDGAASAAESCLMAQIAAENGITAIAMTPHCNVPDYFDNYASAQLTERFQRLDTLLQKEKIPLKVYPGMEVYVTDELPDLLRQGKLLTLAGSRYLLVEFGFDEPFSFMEQMLYTVKSFGLTPIVAHPERYYCVQDDPAQLYQWADEGVVLQLNKGSLFGLFGNHAARAAHWCLGEGCVHLVGSDAHSPYRRTPRLAEAWDYIADYNAPEIARFLLQDNPQRIINNESVRPVLAEF